MLVPNEDMDLNRSEIIQLDKDVEEDRIIPTIVYATENVNIREFADISSESVGMLFKNNSIEKIEEYNNEWSKVLYDNQEYYIHNDFLTDTEPIEKTEKYRYLGTFKITAYCGGTCCNGSWAGQTSTGVKPSEGRTIAVAPWVISYGTEVYIEGVGYRVAEDTGGFANKNDHQIDLFFYDHKDTEIWGIQYRKVWVK